jgi:predicted transposase/invertase (TIGR01784 family)
LTRLKPKLKSQELQPKPTNDILFKMVFVKYPELLKHLVSQLLSISYDDIKDFRIINTEIPPELLGGKFCRLDLNMNLNGQRVNLEVQVADEKNYVERSLYLWTSG